MKRIHTLLIMMIFVIFIVVLPPISFSSPLSNSNGKCEDCHSDFRAFSIIIDAPSEVPENYEFEYKVVVKSGGEHSINNLIGVIDLTGAPNLDIALMRGEPYHEEISGSVSFGGSQTYSFPILEGASDASIILDGDEGIIGRNDIDLTVTSPNDNSWVSESPGADEQVSLDSQDISRGGYGEYTGRVDYFIGGPSISFTLTIDVEYELNRANFQEPDLASGEEYTFVLPIKSKAKGENTISVAVKGIAYHEHGEEEPSASDSHEYTYEKTSNLKVGDKYVYNPPSDEFEVSINIILLERITGLLSALILIASIGLAGYFRPLRSRIEKMLGGKASRVKWHCRVSLALLLLSLMHGLMLPFSPHASSLRGLLNGTFAFVLLSFLGYIGWQQKSLMNRWSPERWRLVHLIFTVIVVLTVIEHAWMDGTDFSWLR